MSVHAMLECFGLVCCDRLLDVLFLTLPPLPGAYAYMLSRAVFQLRGSCSACIVLVRDFLCFADSNETLILSSFLFPRVESGTSTSLNDSFLIRSLLIEIVNR